VLWFYFLLLYFFLYDWNIVVYNGKIIKRCRRLSRPWRNFKLIPDDKIADCECNELLCDTVLVRCDRRNFGLRMKWTPRFVRDWVLFCCDRRNFKLRMQWTPTFCAILSSIILRSLKAITRSRVRSLWATVTWHCAYRSERDEARGKKVTV